MKLKHFYLLMKPDLNVIRKQFSLLLFITQVPLLRLVSIPFILLHVAVSIEAVDVVVQEGDTLLISNAKSVLNMATPLMFVIFAMMSIFILMLHWPFMIL